MLGSGNFPSYNLILVTENYFMFLSKWETTGVSHGEMHSSDICSLFLFWAAVASSLRLRICYFVCYFACSCRVEFPVRPFEIPLLLKSFTSMRIFHRGSLGGNCRVAKIAL